MPKRKQVESLLSKLGEDYEINWDGCLESAMCIPKVLLNKSRRAIFDKKYFTAERILKNYSVVEEVFEEEHIYHNKKLRADFLNQRQILDGLKSIGCYFDDDFRRVGRAYE